MSLLPQQKGLKKGDKDKYLKAKKNIKKLDRVDIVKLKLPGGLTNSLQHIRDKSAPKKPKKKIIKKVVAPASAPAPKKPRKKIVKKKVVAPASAPVPKKPRKKIVKKKSCST